ncbi:MAG TPA: SGNH/GDSL hydrolase family protein, partial [Thermoanaerobaculia bacterium]|nr:SGNH/GDSL hydrolase family protein [Thermoanaerobaculia bacterium]
MEVNRYGFRGEEPRLAKPAGTFRVALLGDSQAEALQVDFEDTFGEVLERRLAACPAPLGGVPPGAGRRVEVLNFGVSGYGTAQALLTLRHAAAPFRPDLALLAVYTGNDVRNNLEELELDPGRPYFRLLPDGSLELDDSFREEPGFRRRASWLGAAAYAALDASRLAQLAKAVW